MIKNKKRTTKYHIIILYDSISQENLEKIKRFNRKDIKIDTLRPSNAEFLLSIKKQHDHVSPAVLFKFAIPSEINYKKILYIDCDTIVMRDLSELYNTNIDNYYAGVVKDAYPVITGYNKKIGIPNYFNAGVMLFNIEKIIQDGIHDKLNSNEILNKTKENYYFEQDTYNIIFKDKVKYLHPKYNFIVDTWDKFGYEKYSQIIGISEQEGKALYEKSVIYHLAAPRKPWIYQDGLMRETWMKYYKSSPFYFMSVGYAICNKNNIKPVKNNNNKFFSIEKKKNRKNITFLGIKIKYKCK